MDSPAKKPRGRPPGSKNKKTSSPSLLRPEPDESSMKLFAFNVPPNIDIMGFIFDIAHKDNVNVTVLNASGTINSLILHNSTIGVTDIIMHGPSTLLSLSGSYFYNTHNTLHPPFPLCFGINIFTSQDKILGGVIGGSLISGDAVSLTISTFKNPRFLNYTYQVEERHNNDNITSGDFNERDNLFRLNRVHWW
ncbi:hypothetical protein DEO72_LG1g2986 [Vigna unguiculata]|uniref:PPC domain-containing protein n=1 Tax=Vigna unguiculata TaxID=3917 RepID=A0A4D6KU30_VIGUN|nr:hypothetical protein DEO72_LG1g2986 [Vigna unguiculata]